MSKLPTLEFTVLAGSTLAINTAQIVQANLAQIGITVKIEVLPTAQFFSAPPNAGSVSYDSALISANQDSQLTWFGSSTFGMAAITPVDLLQQAVNGKAFGCNYAIYATP